MPLEERVFKASNGVTVVMTGSPNFELIDHAMADLYRKVAARKKKEGGRNAA